MASVYLGVRFTSAAYERFLIENVNLDSKIEQLKFDVSKKTNIPHDEIELVYCGRVLNDEICLNEQGVKSGVTLHIMKKRKIQVSPKSQQLSNAEIQNVVWQFRSLLSSHFHCPQFPEILSEILEAYPTFRTDLGALAFLKDPILLSSMQNPETVKRVSEHYSILIEAAEFIVKTFKRHTQRSRKATTPTLGEDQLSDSSSSSEGNTPSTSRDSYSMAQAITRSQLAAALEMAGSASLNSLSNIAQRTLDDGNDSGETSTGNASTDILNAGSQSATVMPRLISPSMLNNALSQALLSSRSSTATSQSQQPPTGMMIPEIVEPQPSSQQPNPPLYFIEMQQMREMGLLNDDINIQALQICNGDVQAAINLVFSGMIN